MDKLNQGCGLYNVLTSSKLWSKTNTAFNIPLISSASSSSSIIDCTAQLSVLHFRSSGTFGTFEVWTDHLPHRWVWDNFNLIQFLSLDKYGLHGCWLKELADLLDLPVWYLKVKSTICFTDPCSARMIKSWTYYYQFY